MLDVARDEKRRAHYRIALRQYTNGVGLNSRRSARGTVHVDIGNEYGEVQVSAEYLRYLGNTSNGLPNYYEGWLILANGYRISMGPISVDVKGCGKSYWRFATNQTAGMAINPNDIRGFAVTAETMDGNTYPSNNYVLVGCVNEGENCLQPPQPAPPSYPGSEYPYNQPWPAEPSAEIFSQNTSIPEMNYFPYQWWELGVPGKRNQGDLLFGYGMNEQGIDRIAFGFPGAADRPVLSSETGEWYPTGEEIPPGYWMYYREPRSGK